MILHNFISLQPKWNLHQSEFFTMLKVMWTLIMKLPLTEVKFYTKGKSQTGLTSLQVSCKCAFMCISDIQYTNIVCRTSAEKYFYFNFVIFSEIWICPHVFVLSSIQLWLFWITWNYVDASGLFFGFYGKCYFLKAEFVNLSQCVWITFRLNFKTFFWWYMLSLYLPL